MADPRTDKGIQVIARHLGRVDTGIHTLISFFMASDDMTSLLEPGMLVRHPEAPDWGIGQVQSNIGGKVTVNFPDEGKVVIDGHRVSLIPVFQPD